MTDTLIKVDLSKSAYENDMVHNRWHPDIPMVATVKPGQDFIIECYDWTGGFIKNDDSAADVRDIDLSIVHFLSGPVGVEGAEPGDLLVVDFLDIGAFPHNSWGFNGFFSKKNGGGFLTDHFPQAQKSIWDFHGMFTSSRHVPGVNFAGMIHPGLIGCLPDPKLLETWNSRETGLIATNPNRVPPLANAPFAPTAHMGRLKGDAKAAAAATGARTVPPREHGGNCDIKDLSRGARVYLPGLCAGRRPLDGRPALQPGRRRDHVLRCDRNARLDPPEGGADQGRHGQVRHQEPDLQAQRDQARLQRLSYLRGHLGRRSRRAALPRRQRGLSPGVPERDRIHEEVRLYAAPRLTRSSAPRRCRATSAAWSISPTPAPRSGCRRRSSTSTSIRARTDPAAASRVASTCRLRWICNGRRRCRSMNIFVRIAVRSSRSGRWRSSSSRSLASSAGGQRRARCSPRRRCPGWMPGVAMRVPLTNVVPTRRSGGNATRRPVAAVPAPVVKSSARKPSRPKAFRRNGHG